MNAYRIKFTRGCPNNGLAIRYRLTITTPATVMAETITAAVAALPAEAFHEALADTLAAALPGRQVLKAHHHGVTIKTVRGGA